MGEQMVYDYTRSSYTVYGSNFMYGVFVHVGQIRSGVLLIQLIFMARTLHINMRTLPPSIARYLVYMVSKIGGLLISS